MEQVRALLAQARRDDPGDVRAPLGRPDPGRRHRAGKIHAGRGGRHRGAVAPDRRGVRRLRRGHVHGRGGGHGRRGEARGGPAELAQRHVRAMRGRGAAVPSGLVRRGGLPARDHVLRRPDRLAARDAPGAGTRRAPRPCSLARRRAQPVLPREPSGHRALRPTACHRAGCPRCVPLRRAGQAGQPARAGWRGRGRGARSWLPHRSPPPSEGLLGAPIRDVRDASRRAATALGTARCPKETVPCAPIRSGT